MKAVTYQSPKRMSVKTIEDPKMQDSRDAVLRVTTAAICGSDSPSFYNGFNSGYQEARV